MEYTIQHISPIRENVLHISQNEHKLSLTFYFQGAECGFSFAQTQHSYKLHFDYSKDALKKKEFEFGNLLNFEEKVESNICCNTQMILHQIISTKYEGKYKKIFVESKALELLLCTIHFIEEIKSPCDTCKFLNQPLEKEKIIQAREIILQNINQPPTIPELAKQIGINQCYLKKGFKEMFKSTVYEYVMEQRMLKAKMLLSLNTQTVSQIAEEVGYSNTSNFSNAFKKYTGLYPSEISKN